MVAHVKRHAEAHYNKGWDVVVETYTDDEIAEVIAGCKTPRGAIRVMGQQVKLLNEREREIKSFIW
jgi:hypothetical protein